MDTKHIRILCSCVAGLSLCCGLPSALANPGGATVVSGSASITSAGNTLTIANSPNAIIQWHDFSISAGETTQFIQQSAASAVLNRVTGGDPSQILGTLQSNGRVFLINPAGVMFGAGAVVDVAGLVASTLNISDDDFVGGRQVYNANIANPGNVTNTGEIRTPSGGFVYLIGTRVENSGVITAPSGEAILAAGHSVELVDSIDPDLRVLVSAQSQDVNLSQWMLENDGNIFGVLNSGRVSANSVTQDATGKIYFKSAGNIETAASSLVEAKGSSELDGGYIQAFALQNGNYGGHFDASGRNGGFLETSAAYLDIGGISLNLRALDSSGHGGSWLLDPFDFLITQTAADSIEAALTGGSSVTIDTNISSFVANDDTYTGSAGLGNITFADNVNITAVGTSSDNTEFNLIANNDIIFGNGVVIDLDGGEEIDLIMSAGGNILGSGATLAAATIAMTAGNDVTANVATPFLQVIAENAIDITALSAVDDVHVSANSLGDPLLANSIQFDLQADPLDSALIKLYGESVAVTSPGDLTLTGVGLTATTGAGGFTFDVAGDLTLTFALVPVGGGLFTVNPSLVLMDASAATMQLSAGSLIVNQSEIDAFNVCPGCSMSITAGSLALTGGGAGGAITSDKDMLIDVGTGSIDLDFFSIEGSVSVAGLTSVQSGALNLTDSAILADIGTLSVDSGALTMDGSGFFGSQLFGDTAEVNASSITMTSSFIGAETDVSVTSAGALALTDSTLSGLGTMNVAAGSATLDGASLIEGLDGLALDVAGALTMNGAEITASEGNLDLTAGAVVMNDATIDANGNLSMNVASLNMTQSTVGDPSGVTPSTITIHSAGDVVLNDASDIVADNEVTLRMLGKLYINSGLSGESHISTFSNNTIFLYFPTLFFGGFIVDGNPDVIVSPFNSFTGFFTGTNLDLPAILNTNLFVFYAPASPITGIVSQNTTNTLATNPYVDSYGNYQNGPGDSSYTYGVVWDPVTGGLNFSEVRECS